MAKKFDKIIVVDLEATCWDETTAAGRKEKGNQVSEIIELGCAAYYPYTYNTSDPKSFYVRPTTSKISQYCTDLTGYTWDFIRKNGTPFEGALNRLRKEYGPKHRVMASWGNYDWYMISQQCLREDLKFPFGRSHINIKELHAVYRKLDKALGLEAALKYEKLEFVGKPHQGRDDAYNASRILGTILRGE
jgi:inhibitor of KinA sporulation pathway (predicted exonuclease)